MRKFFYSTFFTLLTAGVVYLGVIWLRSGTISPSLEFKLPEEVLIGVPFNIEIKVSNDSGQILKNASISLALPEDIVFVGQSSEESLISKKIGNLGVGSLSSESFLLMIISGETNSAKQIKSTVSYTPESLDSRFEKEEKFEIKVSGPAINVEVTAPDKLSSGGQLDMKISYENISSTDLNNLFLEIEYPEAFKYQKSTINPDKMNSYWDLGSLHKGSKDYLLVTGKLISQENTSHIFKVKLGVQFEEESYFINEQIISVSIKNAPVSLSLSANNVSEYIASPGDLIDYKVGYNYLDKPPANSAVLTVKFSGEMFENSAPLQWNISDLEKSGEVSFKARVRGDYPIKRLGDRNFVLKVEAQLDDGTNIIVAELESKVIGRIDIKTSAFFRDASSGILNQGPFSPKSGDSTQYTVHWEITNYSNDARNVVVRAKLPDHVKFTDTTKSNISNQPIYDPNSGEVIWEVGRVSATKGVVSDPLEAIFQISAVSPTSFIGQYLPLVGETLVSGTDEFTGFTLSDNYPSINTRLEDDKTVGEGEGKVLAL